MKKQTKISGSKSSTKAQSQTVTPFQFKNWIYLHTEKPRYYDPVNIFTGEEILYNWHRLSDGDHEYYCNCDTTDNRVVYEEDVILWQPPSGVTYPKYEPHDQNPKKEQHPERSQTVKWTGSPIPKPHGYQRYSHEK